MMDVHEDDGGNVDVDIDDDDVGYFRIGRNFLSTMEVNMDDGPGTFKSAWYRWLAVDVSFVAIGQLEITVVCARLWGATGAFHADYYDGLFLASDKVS